MKPEPVSAVLLTGYVLKWKACTGTSKAHQNAKIGLAENPVGTVELLAEIATFLEQNIYLKKL